MRSTTPAAQIDVAAATADANRRVRARLDDSTSYIAAIGDEIHIVARCIADDVLYGSEPHAAWVAEYFALEQMRDRCLASWQQDRAAAQRVMSWVNSR
jgi:hypothetical protein